MGESNNTNSDNKNDNVNMQNIRRSSLCTDFLVMNIENFRLILKIICKNNFKNQKSNDIKNGNYLYSSPKEKVHWA